MGRGGMEACSAMMQRGRPMAHWCVAKAGVACHGASGMEACGAVMQRGLLLGQRFTACVWRKMGEARSSAALSKPAPQQQQWGGLPHGGGSSAVRPDARAAHPACAAPSA